MARFSIFSTWKQYFDVEGKKLLHRTMKTSDAKEYPGLDLLRGGAALLVMAEHARSFVLRDFSEIASPTLLDKAVYFTTGLGNQGVMIFFVLSGFLISRSIIIANRQGRWDWIDYSIARLSRLWTVLIPSLVFTLFVDWIAQAIGGASFYNGDIASYHSGPNSPEGAQYSPAVFLGNVAFLQGVSVPVFGSNGPLWSLANEFWYYVLFPLGFCLFRSERNAVQRLIYGCLFLLGCFLLPPKLLALGFIWLLGYGVFVIFDQKYFSDTGRRSILIVVGVICFGVALIVSRLGLLSSWSISAELALGLGVAILTLALLNYESSIYQKLGSRFFSKISYTMYLFHFPLLAFGASVLLHNKRFEPGFEGYAIFAAFMLVGIAVSYLLFLCFERQTGVVRHILRARLRRRLSSTRQESV